MLSNVILPLDWSRERHSLRLNSLSSKVGRLILTSGLWRKWSSLWRQPRLFGLWWLNDVNFFLYFLLNGNKVVFLAFNQIVLSPDGEPFSMLVFQDHLIFLLLNQLGLGVDFEACKHLSQQVMAQVFKSLNLACVKICAIVTPFDVEDLFPEHFEILLDEISVSDSVETWLGDEGANKLANTTLAEMG